MSLTFALSVLLTATTPLLSAPPESPIKVVSVRTSSHLPKWKGYTFDAANLIDGRVDTSWQPAKNDTLGVGQWVELDLGETYEITRIEIAQGLQKTDPKLGDLFCRNNRLAEAALWLDDGTTGRIDLGFPPSATTLEVHHFYRGPDNTPGKAVKTAARRLRLIVEQVLEPVDWTDLAIAEIRVYGRPTAAPTIDTSIAWDRPGSWPFRMAVSDFCAVNTDTRATRRCDMLMPIVGQNDHGLASRAPLPTLDPTAIERGSFRLAFGKETRFELDFEKSPKDDRWLIKKAAVTAGDGTPKERAWESWFTEDHDGDNPCWEKLGKARSTE